MYVLSFVKNQRCFLNEFGDSVEIYAAQNALLLLLHLFCGTFPVYYTIAGHRVLLFPEQSFS